MTEAFDARCWRANTSGCRERSGHRDRCRGLVGYRQDWIIGRRRALRRSIAVFSDGRVAGVGRAMVAIGERCGLDHRRDAARFLRRRHRLRHRQSGGHLALAARVRRQCRGWRDRKRVARFFGRWYRHRADPSVYHRRVPCRGISTRHQDCGRSRTQAIPRPCDRNGCSGDNARNRHPLSAVGGLGRQPTGGTTGAHKPEPARRRWRARRMVLGDGRPAVRRGSTIRRSSRHFAIVPSFWPASVTTGTCGSCTDSGLGS